MGRDWVKKDKRKKKFGSSAIGVIFVLFVAYQILKGILDTFIGAPATPTTSAPQPADTSPSGAPYYALNAVKSDWPPGKGSGAVAANLLTPNYYVILDGSGSMSHSECSGGTSKMAAAKTALKQFVLQVPADANLGLLVFDQKGVKERMPLGQHARSDLQNAIEQVTPGGGTPLSAAISQGYQALVAEANRQLGYGEYHLVVVTDGEANSGFEPNKVVGQVMRDSPVVMHTIGFCIRGDHSLNQQGLTLYKAADNPDSLSEGLQSVLAELPDFNVQAFEGK